MGGLRILWDELRLRRFSLAMWSLAVAVTVALVVALYPSIGGNKAYDQVIENFPPELRELFGTTSLGSATGYLSTELYGFFLPAILIAYAIGRGAACVAGEEEGHTLDLLLAQPVSRVSAYLQKAAAMVIGVVILSIVSLVPILLLREPADIDIPVGNLVAITVQQGLLAITFGTIALLVSVVVGRRAPGMAVAGGLAFLTYLIEGLGRSIDWLGDWRWLSPWNWYSAEQPIANGLAATYALVFVLVGLVVAAAGLVVFQRRNLHA